MARLALNVHLRDEVGIEISPLPAALGLRTETRVERCSNAHGSSFASLLFRSELDEPDPVPADSSNRADLEPANFSMDDGLIGNRNSAARKIEPAILCAILGI
jgi:hypothetical protein